MTLWLVAGDADALPGREQRADHPRAGVGLARAGRALDRKGRVVEGQREAACRFKVGFAWPAELLVQPLPDSGRQTEQQVAAGAVRPVASIPWSATHTPRS